MYFGLQQIIPLNSFPAYFSLQQIIFNVLIFHPVSHRYSEDMKYLVYYVTHLTSILQNILSLYLPLLLHHKSRKTCTLIGNFDLKLIAELMYELN